MRVWVQLRCVMLLWWLLLWLLLLLRIGSLCMRREWELLWLLLWRWLQLIREGIAGKREEERPAGTPQP